MSKFYVFTGTHSTGKTTVLDELKGKVDLDFHRSITRYAKEQGVELNTDVTDEGQLKILEIYEQYEKDFLLDHDVLMDRCLIDTLAYSMYFFDQDLIKESTLSTILHAMRERLSKYTHIFYFPIEFENELDGTRIDDDKFRKGVDAHIRFIFDFYDIPHTVITGSVEERTAQILKVIND